jgi:hypothetical protein
MRQAKYQHRAQRAAHSARCPLLVVLRAIKVFLDSYLGPMRPVTVLRTATYRFGRVRRLRKSFELQHPASADFGNWYSIALREPEKHENVAMILEIGSTVIYEKFPKHLITTLTCVKDCFIYSDVQWYFSGGPVRDALVRVSVESRNKHSDLEHRKTSMTMCALVAMQ